MLAGGEHHDEDDSSGRKTGKGGGRLDCLGEGQLPPLTKWDVLGRGKQQGILLGSQIYNELSKTMIMVVVDDEQAERVMQVIHNAAFTGYPGDGKIWVTPVEAAYSVRTGQAGL